MSDVAFLNALLTKLRLDVGAGSLVALTGGVANIFRAPLPEKLRLPSVGVGIVSETALDPSVTGWKTYTVKISGNAVREVDAITLSDRVQYLFDDVSGSETNRSFYDFTDSNCTVRSTRWLRKVPRVKHVDENVTYWNDSNIIIIVANPYLGC